jgi:hypothetical protein
MTNAVRYRIEDLPMRIAAKIRVNPSTGCWEWQGYRNPKGYGQLTWQGKCWKTHRLVYTLLAGTIPDGLTLDHVTDRGCASKACCWPAHLEPVTDEVNNLRAGTLVAINAAKTQCEHGHGFDLINTRIRPCGRRRCRACERERDSRRPRRQRSRSRRAA